MATKKPQLISTSQRLRVEQHIFWFERIALFLLCILFIQLFKSLPQITSPALFLNLIFLFNLILTTNLMYIYFSVTKVVLSYFKSNPSVKREAKHFYKLAELLDIEGLYFWLERFGISLSFILFLLYTDPTIEIRRFAAVTASLFLASNVAYFLLFMESEELYVQKNNTTSLKKTNKAGKGKQRSNSNASASGSSMDLKKAELVEVKKNEKVMSESKAICDQQALEKAEDELCKLKTEYENLKASHVEELRKAIEQCTRKYEMKLKEKKYKLHEEYSKVIEELHEEYGKVLEECKKYYQMKLNKKNDKRKVELKKMKDEHEENRQKWKEEVKKAMEEHKEEHKEDHRKWEEEKIHLVTELVAATASSEHYRYLLQDGGYSFQTRPQF